MEEMTTLLTRIAEALEMLVVQGEQLIALQQKWQADESARHSRLMEVYGERESMIAEQEDI